jgi:hypothetical protein
VDRILPTVEAVHPGRWFDVHGYDSLYSAAFPVFLLIPLIGPELEQISENGTQFLSTFAAQTKKLNQPIRIHLESSSRIR